MSLKNRADDELIEKIKSYKSEESYWKAISVLRNRPGKALFDQCKTLIDSNQKDFMLIGITILAQLGQEPRPFLNETLKIYFDLLAHEKDPEILSTLIYSLGHNSDHLTSSQINKICSFVNSSEKNIREALSFTLGGLDHPKAIEGLIRLSSDKYAYIRNWATFGLGTLSEIDNKEIRETLWERISDKHQETRYEAIKGLALRKESRIKPIIEIELNKDGLGSLLFEAIIATEDKSFLPQLKSILKKNEGAPSINPGWLADLKDCITELTRPEAL